MRQTLMIGTLLMFTAPTLLASDGATDSFESADRNGDGIVDLEEAAHGGVVGAFDKADHDGDRFLNRQEYADARAQIES